MMALVLRKTDKTEQHGQHSFRFTVTGHYCLQSVIQ